MIIETFDEACSALSGFLQREGQSPELFWICREDVTGMRSRIFVHPSPPAINRSLYQRHFEFGVRQAFGVRLDVLCFVGSQACCYVWVPGDEVEASQAMLADNLCFSYAVEGMGSQRGFQAARSGNSASFFIRRVWSRLLGESPPIQEIPSRSDLESNPK